MRSEAGKDDPVYLDIPEKNKAALDLVNKYDMRVVFETVRMYTCEEPDIDLNRLYGVTTFELG